MSLKDARNQVAPLDRSKNELPGNKTAAPSAQSQAAATPIAGGPDHIEIETRHHMI
jgi:hypothetical protein